MSDLVGKQVANRYLVQSLVASGGMASVYLAKDLVLEREVALKVIHPHLVRDKSFLAKFEREAKVAAKLSHPNLVNVFDQGAEGDEIFMAMEYVPGITLREALRDFGKLEPLRTLEIIEALTSALAAVHANGVLHRDLKPENIFLSDDGRVKLGDFGLARRISDHTQTGSIVGTVAYLPPELISRSQADARSDIYSLGILIYELLTGDQPFRGEQAVQVALQHAQNQVPKPSIATPELPEILDELVLWLTAKNPNHRPKDAVELLPIVKRIREDLSSAKTVRLNQLAETMRIERTERLPDLALPTELINPAKLEISEPPEQSKISRRLERASAFSRGFALLLTVLAIFGGAGVAYLLG